LLGYGIEDFFVGQAVVTADGLSLQIEETFAPGGWSRQQDAEQKAIS